MRSSQQDQDRQRRRFAAVATALGLVLAALSALLLPWFQAPDPGSGSDDWHGSITHADLRSWIRTVGGLGPDLTHWFSFGWLAVICCVVILIGVRSICGSQRRWAVFAGEVVLVAIAVTINLKLVLGAPLALGLAAIGCWLPRTSRWTGITLALVGAAVHGAFLVLSGVDIQLGAVLPLVAFIAFAAASFTATSFTAPFRPACSATSGSDRAVVLERDVQP